PLDMRSSEKPAPPLTAPDDPLAPPQPGELAPAKAPPPGMDDGKRRAPHQPSTPQLPETD
ncbi:MAG TPA: hypothetical protein VF407_05085, partial [Polyangiaceae bacterium]